MQNINDAIIAESFRGSSNGASGRDGQGVGHQDFDVFAQIPGDHHNSATQSAGLGAHEDATFSGDLLDGEFRKDKPSRKLRRLVFIGASAIALVLAVAGAALQPSIRAKLGFGVKQPLDLSGLNLPVLNDKQAQQPSVVLPAADSSSAAPPHQDSIRPAGDAPQAQADAMGGHGLIIIQQSTAAAASQEAVSPSIATTNGQTQPTPSPVTADVPATTSSPPAVQPVAAPLPAASSAPPDAVAAPAKSPSAQEAPAAEVATKPSKAPLASSTEKPASTTTAKPVKTPVAAQVKKKAEPVTPASDGLLIVNDVKPLVSLTAAQFGLRSISNDVLVLSEERTGYTKKFRVGDSLPSGERITHIDAVSRTIVTNHQIIRITN